MASVSRVLALPILIAVFAGALAFSGSIYLDRLMNAPQPIAGPTRIDIKAGSSLRAALAQLHRAGLLPEPHLTELYLRAHRAMFGLKAGRYEIATGSTPLAVLSLLRSGKVVLEQLTVIEGSTFADFRRSLESHPEVHGTIKGRSDAEIMRLIGHGGEFPEGRFFPDTYRFAAGTSDLELLRMAYDRMHAMLEGAWPGRSEGLPLNSSYQALILASIVEKETGLREERPHIASVFLNRLKSGMRLQSDPTVIYGIGAAYDGDIRSRDLITDTPYNTYTRAGLPPTPIALPGAESILAVLHPANTDDLYFVALGDGSGAHAFNSSLEAHNAAVRRYLERLKTQQRGGTER